jgi:hypothetical protein
MARANSQMEQTHPATVGEKAYFLANVGTIETTVLITKYAIGLARRAILRNVFGETGER